MEKRDKIGIIIWLCVMLAATIGIEIRERWTWRLFGNLRQEDVVAIDVVVGIYPPYRVSQVDQMQIVECMQQMEVSIHVTGNIPYFYIQDGFGCIFWAALLHIKDGSKILLDIAYPGTFFTINNEKEYICHNSELAFQIYDICEPYADLIRAAN